MKLFEIHQNTCLKDCVSLRMNQFSSNLLQQKTVGVTISNGYVQNITLSSWLS